MRPTLAPILVVTLSLAQSCVAPKDRPARPVLRRPPKSEARPVDRKPPIASDARSPTSVLRVREEKSRPNGLRVLRVPAAASELARLGLYIDAGYAREPQTKPGIATMCARILRASGHGGRPGQVLDQTLTELGANLEVRTTGRLVRIEGACPPENALEFARVLFRFVTQDPASLEAIDRVRNQMLREVRGPNSNYERLSELRRLLGETVASKQAFRTAIANFESAEIRLFTTLHYRPNNTRLVIMLPGESAENTFVANKIAKEFDAWKKGTALSPVSQPGTVIPIAFAEHDLPRAEVTTVLRSPSPTTTGDGVDFCTWQHLTIDSSRGLLRRFLNKRGFPDLPLDVEQLDTGRSHTIMLTARVLPSRVTALRDALREAIAALAIQEPSVDELEILKARSLFLWDTQLVAPIDRMRTFVESSLRRQRKGLDARVIRSIEKLQPSDLPRAALGRFIPVFLVRGPAAARPRRAARLPAPLDSEPQLASKQRTHPLNLSPSELERLRKRTLARARSELGGQLLDRLTELTVHANGQNTASLPFADVWHIVLPDGPLSRSRTILGTTIQTFSDPKTGVIREVVGPDQRTLDGVEAAFFKLEARLNPTILLAWLTKLKKRLDLIGSLEVEGRRMLVFENSDATASDRIRLAIDEASALPRRLEYREWRPDASAQRASLEFQDYRLVSQLGVRMPHLIRKFIEGEFRGEMTLTYGALRK